MAAKRSKICAGSHLKDNKTVIGNAKQSGLSVLFLIVKFYFSSSAKSPHRLASYHFADTQAWVFHSNKLETTMIRRTFIALAATATLMGGAAYADGHSKDIVDNAVAAGRSNTLAAACPAAGRSQTR